MGESPEPHGHTPTLLGVLAAFIWMRDSGPVYTTRPRM